MDFHVSGLARDEFEPLFHMTDEALAAMGARRCVVDRTPGFPCRVSLVQASPGETVILLPYRHQPARSPYQASGPIFVREAAVESALAVNEVPDMLRTGLLSVRAYDRSDSIVTSDVVQGTALEPVVARLFDDERVSYLHAHYAGHGCYACRIDRA